MVLTTTKFIGIQRIGLCMTSSAPDTPPPKSTLICPECDHTSPPDGDWRVAQRFKTAVYRCPCCGTDVVERPSTAGIALHEQFAAITAPIRVLWSGYLRGIHRLLGR